MCVDKSQPLNERNSEGGKTGKGTVMVKVTVTGMGNDDGEVKRDGEG